MASPYMVQAAAGGEQNNYDVATAEQLRGSVTSGLVVTRGTLAMIETACNFLTTTPLELEMVVSESIMDARC